VRQRAQIVQTEGNTAWVKIADPSRDCGDCQGCIRLTPKQKAEDQLYHLPNPIGAEAGDWVIIDQPTRELYRAVAVLYGLPLLGLLLGYAVGYHFLGADAPAGLGAMAGLLLSIFAARPIANQASKNAQQPQVVAKSCMEPLHST